MARPRESVGVVHFSTSDLHGGAAKAATRLHEALVGQRVNSRMVVLNRLGDGSSVRRVGGPSARLEASLLVRDAAHKAVQYTVKPTESFDFDLAAFSAPLRALKVEASGADVLHLHWIRGLLSTGQLACLASSGKPVIWTLMDLAPITGGCHYPGGCSRFETQCGNCPVIKSKHGWDSSRRTWTRRKRHYDRSNITFVAPTRWVADQTLRSSLVSDAKCVRIPLAVDTETFAPRDRVLARQVLRLPAEGLLVFCAAQQLANSRKGLAEFLESLRRLRAMLDEREPALADTVTIVTAGNSVSSEIAKDFKHVHLGFLGDDRVLALAHQAADVFASTSLEDAGPMILNEALACGTPAIAFDTGGAREWLGEAEGGYVARLGDVADFAEVLASLLCNRERRLGAGLRARALALAQFSPQVVADKYFRLYEETLGAS